MQYKWIGFMTLLLPMMGWAQDSVSQQTSQQLGEIEQKLTILKKKMHEMQVKELNDEVEGQGYMIADWQAYSREVQEIKDLKEQERQLKAHIDHLERRKAALLKQGNGQ